MNINDFSSGTKNGGLSAPSITASAVSDQRIQIEWGQVAAADYYEVHSSNTNDLKLSGVDTTTDNLKWTVHGLRANTERFFWVKACKSDGFCSNYSEVKEATTLDDLTSPPAPPDKTTFIFKPDGETVLFSWVETEFSNYYEIKFTKNPDFVTDVKTVLSEQSIETVLGIPDPNTDYFFWLRACNILGCSESEKVTVLTAPGIPDVLGVFEVNGEDSVYWTAPARGADTYNLYRSQQSDSATAVLVGTTSGTSYSDPQTSKGATYYYWVKACNSGGCSNFSLPSTFIVRPALPTWKEPSIFSNRIKLEWNASVGATKYEVRQNSTNQSTTSIVKSSSITETSYYVTNNISANTSYFYWVVACNLKTDGTLQCSDYSETKEVTTLPVPAAAPSSPPSLTGAVATDKSLTLTWNPVGDSTDYDVFIDTSDTPPSGSAMAKVIAAEKYVFTNLSVDTEYNMWVKACNPKGCSNFSSSFTARTDPRAATVVTSPISSTQIDLTWNAEASATKYQVYFNTTGTVPKKSAAPNATINAPTAAYSVNGLTPGTLYYFWVNDCNNFGCSSFATTPVNGRTYTIIDARVASDEGITVTADWSGISDGKTISIKEGLAPGNEIASVTKGPNTSVVSIAGLNPNTIYTVWAEACSYPQFDCSRYSEPSAALKTAPPAPILSVPAVINDEIDLAWIQSDAATSYRVFRSKTDKSTDVAEISSSPTTNTSLTDSNPPSPAYYYYWVKACNDDGNCSRLSSPEGVRIGELMPPDLNLKVSGPSRITLEWSEALGSDSYQIFKSENNIVPNIPEATVAMPSEREWSNFGLDPNKTYYFWVKACSGSFCSAPSTAKSGSTAGFTVAPYIDISSTNNVYISSYATATLPNEFAFAVIDANGRIYSWGSNSNGAPADDGYVAIFSSKNAFTAMRHDGSVKSWGDSGSIVNAPGPDETFDSVYSSYNAWVGLKADGTIRVWGNRFSGGAQHSSPANPYYGNAPEESETFVSIRHNLQAFAGLKADGTIKAWGNLHYGGIESLPYTGPPTDSGYTKIFSAYAYFTALKADGSITVWGLPENGSSTMPTDAGYIDIYQLDYVSAGIKADGSITPWRCSTCSLSKWPSNISNYNKLVQSSGYSFAILKPDGSIFPWGEKSFGGALSNDPPETLVNPSDAYSNAPADLTGFKDIVATSGAFAGLKLDGSIEAWGRKMAGGLKPGDTFLDNVAAPTGNGFTKIFSNNVAFAALKADGSITAWGQDHNGGTSAPTDSGYVHIYSNSQAFAAIKADGTISVWGNANNGGSGGPTGSGWRFNNTPPKIPPR